jgi:hypothetical protein
MSIHIALAEVLQDERLRVWFEVVYARKKSMRKDEEDRDQSIVLRSGPVHKQYYII